MLNEIIERAGKPVPYLEMHKDIITRQKNKCASCGRSLSFASRMSYISGSIYCEKCAGLAGAKDTYKRIGRNK